VEYTGSPGGKVKDDEVLERLNAITDAIERNTFAARALPQFLSHLITASIVPIILFWFSGQVFGDDLKAKIQLAAVAIAIISYCVVIALLKATIGASYKLGTRTIDAADRLRATGQNGSSTTIAQRKQSSQTHEPSGQTPGDKSADMNLTYLESMKAAYSESPQKFVLRHLTAPQIQAWEQAGSPNLTSWIEQDRVPFSSWLDSRARRSGS
jgi:ABC-type transport system involved in cytochrome bd biosynthesis fused ATPase/permease subunit